MTIIIKNKETLLIDDFKFKCSIGRKGFSRHKKEGDSKTPIGTFKLGEIFYRKDKSKNSLLNLKQLLSKKIWVGVMTKK